MYEKRHDRIVELVNQKIRSSVQATENIDILKDTILKPYMFESVEEEFTHSHARPHIVSINRDKKEVTITEISVPFDAHLDNCYKNKFYSHSST